MTVRLRLNGRDVVTEAPPEATLQQVLHERLGATEVKRGCGEGVCGSCVVLFDGQPAASCLVLAAQADGRDVVTVAGLDGIDERTQEAHRAVRAHLAARGAFQCGYCAPGFVVEATYYLRENPDPRPDAVRAALAGHFCRCTGYEPIVEAVAAAAAGHAPPRDRPPRADDLEKLDGVALYPTDVVPRGALHGRLLWSEHPSARILSVDTSGAEAVPGVEAVLTSRDIPGDNVSGEVRFGMAQPLLAADVVRCTGEVVAAVAARTEAAAREAIRRIRVRYEPRPAVLDPWEALASGAPRVGRGRNVIATLTHTRGDLDAGFRRSEVVVERTYATDANDHACLELEGGAAYWDGDDLVIAAQILTPHSARAVIARVLSMDPQRVRIDCPRMGGSFGKYLAPGIEAHLALLAWKTRRPVRLVLDREEILAHRPKRNPFQGRYRMGLRRDGRIMALDADLVADSGPYAALTPTVVAVFADEVAGAYHVPHLRATARGVLTNNVQTTAMRGFGSQQIIFGIELLMDAAARQLGMDPVELRRRNLRPSTSRRSAPGATEQAGALSAALDRVVDRLGPRPEPPPGWRAGRGVALARCKYGYPRGLVDRFVARISVDSAGRFVLESDIPDSGTGILAGAARLVADRLGLTEVPESRLAAAIVSDPTGVLFATGRPPTSARRRLYRSLEWLQISIAAKGIAVASVLPPRAVRVLVRLVARPMNHVVRLPSLSKTRLFPLGIDSFVPRTSGSRGMLMLGLAAAQAAAKFEDVARAAAARALGAPAESLVVGGSGVRTNDGGRSVSWADLARAAGGTISAIGDATLPEARLLDPKGNQSGPVDHMVVCHGCDVLVNPQTGEVRFVRYAACHDAGTVVDHTLVRGQIWGSVAMGIGQALAEDLRAGTGVVGSDSLHTYHVPSILDLPVDVVVDVLESGTGAGPAGAKGVAEGGAVAAPAAVANALSDALGVQIRRIPATPEALASAASPGAGDGASSPSLAG